jgi:methyl coenzyme M reductase subunit C-like uncharacterized protein (methanogenesis marker protein 7)
MDPFLHEIVSGHKKKRFQEIAMLEPVKFRGCAADCQRVIELMEDFGGHLMESFAIGDEVILLMQVPSEDIPLMEELAKDLCGDFAKGEGRDQ